MSDNVIKIIPNELDGNSRYSIRVRSVNSFGVTSDWSEVLIIDTDDASSSTGGRLALTSNGMIAYDANGQTSFVYSGESTGSRTNLVVNPSFEINTNGWTADGSCSISRVTTDFYVGETGYKASLKVAASTSASGIGITTSIGDRITVSPGETYTVSAYIKSNISISIKIGLAFFDSGGTLLKTTYSLSPRNLTGDGLWTRISSVGTTVPNNSVKMAVIITSTSTINTGQFYLIDGVLAEKSSTLGDYFDGSTSIGATKWSGTPHYSTSTFDLTSSYFVDGGVFTAGTLQTAVDVGVGSPFGKAGVKMSTTGIQGYSGLQATPSFSLDTAGKFRVGGLNNYIYWDGTTLTVAGNVAAGTIDIGGFDNTSFHVDSSGQMWMGSGTYSSAPFKVSAGGSIYSISGTIGGFTVDDKKISSSNSAYGINVVRNSTNVATPVDSIQFKINTTVTGGFDFGINPYRPVISPGMYFLSASNPNAYSKMIGVGYEIGTATPAYGVYLSSPLNNTGDSTTAIYQNNYSDLFVGSGSINLNTNQQLNTLFPHSSKLYLDSKIFSHSFDGGNYGSFALNAKGTGNHGSEAIFSAAIYMESPKILVSGEISRLFIGDRGDGYSLFGDYDNVTENTNYYGMAVQYQQDTFISGYTGKKIVLLPGGQSTNRINMASSSNIFEVVLSGTTKFTVSDASGGSTFVAMPNSSAGSSVRYDGLGQLLTASSRRELKDNIEDIEDPLNIINQLRPRKFTWKPKKEDSPETAALRPLVPNYGFIVEEVLEISPHLIDWVIPDIDPSLNDEEKVALIKDLHKWKPGYWSVDQFISLLVKAVQDLDKRLKSIE